MPLLQDAERQLISDGNLPAFVYFERILHENLRYLRRLLAGVPNCRQLYSLKAATFPFLLRTLHRWGIAGFDASSATEAEYAHHILSGRAPLYVTAPAPNEKEWAILRRIKPAYVHLDSLPSLEAILSLGDDVPLGIRINPGVTYSRQAIWAAGGAQSRLGIPIHHLGDALELFRRYGRKELGIHFHVSCEADSLDYHTAAVRALDEQLQQTPLAGLRLTHLDVGGGLRAPLWDFEKDALVPSIDEDSTADFTLAVESLMARQRASLADDFTLFFEPGDFLVCAAAVLMSRVVERRQNFSGGEHLILDTNINHFPSLLHNGTAPVVIPPRSAGVPPAPIGRPARSHSEAPGETPVARGRDARTPPATEVTLSGNSCLGGDHLAKTSISEDPEHITFSERGSYEYSQINFFNGRFRPSVYLLEESGALTMVKEDTLEDLTGYWRESVPHFPEPYQSFPYFEEIARQESGLYLYHPKMRWVSSFELDPESFPAPASLARALFDNFASHSMTYGRSLGRVEVRDRIAAYENGIVGAPGFYNNANVGFTLGATSAFWLIINSFLIGKSRRLLIHCPTYYQYSFSASSYKIPWTHVHQREPFQLGHELVVPPERFLPSADDVIAAVGGAPDIGALVIANPGLPYGCKQKPDDVRRLAEKARAENWLLILDETLMELDPAGADESHWRWLDHSYPIVRIKSASKTFGLAGLRIGYFCVTDAVCTLFGSQDALFEKMGGLADTIYSAPPAVFGPVLAAALDLLEDRRAQRFDRQDVAQFQANLQKLRQNADRAGKILTEWNIPYVVPESGMNIMAFLPKLRNVKTDSIEFFRRLIREHSIFVDLGGMFSQNPAWNCTMARIGLGRPEQHFERDLIDLCRFHDAYDAPTADGARTRVMISSSVSTDEQLFA